MRWLENVIHSAAHGALHGVPRRRIVDAAMDPRRAEVRCSERDAERACQRSRSKSAGLDGISRNVCIAELDEVAVQSRGGEFGGGESVAGEVQERRCHAGSVPERALPASGTAAVVDNPAVLDHEEERSAAERGQPGAAGLESLGRGGDRTLVAGAFAAASSSSSLPIASVSWRVMSLARAFVSGLLRFQSDSSRVRRASSILRRSSSSARSLSRGKTRPISSHRRWTPVSAARALAMSFSPARSGPRRAVHAWPRSSRGMPRHPPPRARSRAPYSASPAALNRAHSASSTFLPARPEVFQSSSRSR